MSSTDVGSSSPAPVLHQCFASAELWVAIVAAGTKVVLMRLRMDRKAMDRHTCRKHFPRPLSACCSRMHKDHPAGQDKGHGLAAWCLRFTDMLLLSAPL